MRIIRLFIISSFILMLTLFGDTLISDAHSSQDNLLPSVDAGSEMRSDDNIIIYGPFEAFSWIDQKDRPVKYVRVKAVTPDGDTYIERTDVEGNAIFEEMPFKEFPNGTKFTARAFTYNDPAWLYGEEIPELENDYWEFVTFGSIVHLSPILIFIFLFILARFRINK